MAKILSQTMFLTGSTIIASFHSLFKMIRYRFKDDENSEIGVQNEFKNGMTNNSPN